MFHLVRELKLIFDFALKKLVNFLSELIFPEPSFLQK